MRGPAGAADPALEQAKLAQLVPRAYADAWLCRYASATGADARLSPASVNTVAIVPSADQAESNGIRPGPMQTRAGTIGLALDGAVQTAKPGQAAPAKPVAPTLTLELREAARLKALRLTAERKMLRTRLQAGEETLEQALAVMDEATRRMPVTTAVRALPGIGAATTARLLREAGIDPGPRAGALTAGQRERLVAAVAAVHADLAARHDRRVMIPATDRDAPRSQRRGRAARPGALTRP